MSEDLYSSSVVTRRSVAKTVVQPQPTHYDSDYDFVYYYNPTGFILLALLGILVGIAQVVIPVVAAFIIIAKKKKKKYMCTSCLKSFYTDKEVTVCTACGGALKEIPKPSK